MSAPVTTACTPASARAAVTSTSSIVACAHGAAHERDVQHAGPHDVVDVAAAAGQEPRVLDPLHAGAEQLRLHAVGDVSHRGLPQQLGGVPDRVDDEHVARAAADVALQREPDLLVGGRRVVLEQRLRGQHHPGRAEPALQAVLLPERLLHRVQRRRVAAERLDRLDPRVRRLHREQQARAHRLAVEQHGAGAADALLAARRASRSGAGPGAGSRTGACAARPRPSAARRSRAG